MDFVRKNKAAIGMVAAGAGIAGLFFYFFYRKGHQRKPSSSKSKLEGLSAQKNLQSKPFLKDKFYLEMIGKLKRAVDSEKPIGLFSKATLTGICKAVFQLFKADYLANYQENRSFRRKYMSNLSDYANELFKGTEIGETLMDEATDEVLKDVGMNKALYEKEFDRLSHEDPNFQLFNIYMLESIKTQVNSKTSVRLTKELLIEYFKHQIGIFGQFNFKDLKHLSPENQMICKQTYLSDMAAMKFKFEEEDIIREPSLFNDPEVYEHQHQLQEMFNKERQNSTMFPY